MADAVALLVFYRLCGPPSVSALPSDPNVTEGSATFQQTDSQTLTITASDRSIIEFGVYDIASGETVVYVLPDTSSTTLSRVVGGSSSEIFGRLSVNGMLFFVNPSGITFGPSAQVNAGGLIASTLPINNADFLAAQYHFDGVALDGLTAVVNQGTITATQGGFAVLVGGAVQNTGTITAPVGTVALASGEAVTVGIASDNSIAIVIDRPVAEAVLDAQGQPITTQLSNSGTIEAAQGHVVLTAKSAQGLFDLAINQQGIIRADAAVVGLGGSIELVATEPVRSTGSMSAAHGLIHVKSDSDVQVGGQALAAGGQVTVEAGRDVTVVQQISTSGETTFKANRNVAVNANVTTDSGNLTFTADADSDGVGAFNQASGTTISTTTFGDITLSASGSSTVGTIASAGSFTLKASSASVTWVQLPGSTVTTAGSFTLQPNATLLAGTTIFQIGRDWVNFGTFEAGESEVWLVGPAPAQVRGSTIFYDFGSTQPGKPITFEAVTVQEIRRKTTFRGEFGDLIQLRSSIIGQPFSLLPQGETILRFVGFQDTQIRGPPVAPVQSQNLGNNTGLDFSLAGPIWVGSASPAWSDFRNWDGGFVPGAFDLVRFTSSSSLDSLVDASFGGTIAGLTLSAGYSGTLTLGRDLTVTGDVTLAGGTLAAGSQTLTVGGDWTLAGGTFQPGTSTVLFNDASRPSTISGSTTFYQFASFTPSKVLQFEAGTTQTILGTWTIRGAYAQHVRLVSTAPGSRWLVDPRGPRDLTYAWVEDSVNLDTDKIIMTESTNRGNSIGWDPTGTWNGAAGGAWSSGANWTGLGGAAPGAGDDVVFNGTKNTNSSIDASFTGTVNSISMNTGYTRTITNNRTGGLTVNSTFTVNSGTYNANGKTTTVTGLTTVSGGTYQASTATQTFNGGLTISSGTFTGSTGAVDVNGNVTLSTGTLTAPSGTFTVSGNWSKTGGTFTPGTNTVTFDGSTTQTLNSGATSFYGITHSGGGTLQLVTNALTVTNAFTNSAGTFDLNGLNWTMTGATFSNDGTVQLRGSETITGLTQDTNSGTFTYVGDGDGLADTFTLLDFGATDYFNLTITTTDSTDVIQSAGAKSIAGALTVSAGTLSLNGNALTVTGAVSNTSTIRLIGSESVTLSSGNDTDSGTWTYVGDGDGLADTFTLLDFGATDYYSLTINLTDANDTVQLGAATTVAGDLTITAGTLDGGSQTLTLSGAGTPFVITSGTFTASTSTVNYTATAATTLAATTYYNLGVGTTSDANPGVTFTLGGNTTVSNVLTMGNASSTNTDTLAGSSYTLTLSGGGIPFNLTSKGVFSAGTSTVIYSGDNAEVTPGTYYQLKVGSNTALARRAGLTLESPEKFLLSAIIDQPNGFAYFGTFTSPGIIVKVRLSDFTRVGQLVLNTGENDLASAIIDQPNQLAYFGTQTSPGIIVKINLATFTRVGALTLNTGEDNLMSAIIDQPNQLAYFGTTTSPGIIVKINLTSFTRVGALTLNTGENTLRSAIIDQPNQLAYFG
ncbi:MAG: filamentous hemagglutinin N-terminal domain-containing protein, partial [Candidatus Omnitrophica bacterium]|nr:filamentous hemagglutinin N-terminal domain-containing protein [Candidatus Omnitrophota bacterium]